MTIDKVIEQAFNIVLDSYKIHELAKRKIPDPRVVQLAKDLAYSNVSYYATEAVSKACLKKNLTYPHTMRDNFGLK